MSEMLHSFKPDKIRLFGNGVTKVEVYHDGIRITRKKNNEEYAFDDIDKIIARGYASPTPIYIFVMICIKNSNNKIEIKLHPNLIDTNALLSAHSDYLLGKDFPNNLNKLDIELGGLGASIRLKNGEILLGERKIPLNEVESFGVNRNGFYDLQIKSIKRKLGISPDYAPNIIASIKIINAIIQCNQR